MILLSMRVNCVFRRTHTRTHTQTSWLVKDGKYIRLIRCHWCDDGCSCRSYCCFSTQNKTKKKARKPNAHSLLGGTDTAAYHLLYAIDQDRLNSVRVTRLNQQWEWWIFEAKERTKKKKNKKKFLEYTIMCVSILFTSVIFHFLHQKSQQLLRARALSIRFPLYTIVRTFQQ